MADGQIRALLLLEHHQGTQHETAHPVRLGESSEAPRRVRRESVYHARANLLKLRPLISKSRRPFLREFREP